MVEIDRPTSARGRPISPPATNEELIILNNIKPNQDHLFSVLPLSSLSTKKPHSPPLPPPASPSSGLRYHRSTSPAPASYEDYTMEELLETETGALETIGEDGESQAGTMKVEGHSSARNLEELVEREESKKSTTTIRRAQDIFAVPDSKGPGISTGERPMSPIRREEDRGLEVLEARLLSVKPPLASSSDATAMDSIPFPTKLSSTPSLDTTTILGGRVGGGHLRARSISRHRSISELARSTSALSISEADTREEAIRERAPSLRRVKAMSIVAVAPEAEQKREKVVQQSTESTTSIPVPIPSPPVVPTPQPAINPAPLLAIVDEATQKPSSKSSRLPSWLTSSNTSTLTGAASSITPSSLHQSPTNEMTAPATHAIRRSTFDFTALPTNLKRGISITRSNSTKAVALDKFQEPTMASLMAADTRAALRSSSPSIKRFTTSTSSPSPSTSQPEALNIPRAYENKSARGGKGGKVLSVASNWAEIVAADEIRYSRSYSELPLPLSSNPISPTKKDGKENGKEVTKKGGERILTSLDGNGIKKSVSTPKGLVAKPFLNETIGKPIMIRSLIPVTNESASLTRPLLSSASTTKTTIPSPNVVKKVNKLSSPGLAKPFLNETMGKRPTISTAASISRSSTSTPESNQADPSVLSGGDKREMKVAGGGPGRVKALVGLFK
jgi:hypothetical protein